MAVAFDAVGPSSAGTNSGTSPLTWTHTLVSGANSVVLAWVTADSANDASMVITCTCGGTSMTAVATAHSNSGTIGFGTLFQLTGVSSGAKTITATVTGGSGLDAMSGGSISFTGADQANPLGTPVTNTSSGTSTPSTAALASNTNGNLIAGFTVAGSQFSSATAPSTSRFISPSLGATNGAGGFSAGATSPATGSSVTMAWVISGPDDWGVVLAEVKPPATPPARVGSVPLPALPPGWFPGSDKVTTQPGGVPFWAQPAPTDATPAVILPPTPEADAAPQLPPGWFPGSDAVTTVPGGVPFTPEPPPLTGTQPVVFPVPEVAGIPDWQPLPPNWFPGASQVTTDPGSIPFYSLPQPLTPPPAPPPSPVPPYVAQIIGTGTAGYFADQFGRPRILRLEQAWALPWNAGRWNGGDWRADIDGYTAARGAQGMTAWFGTAWADDHVDATCLSKGRTWDGIYPFTVNGTPGGITTSGQTIGLNNPFWQRIDYLFRSALAQGISCFLNIGMQYDFTGANNVFFNLGTTQAQTFGQLIANRYPVSAWPNVFFFFGDDGSGGQDTLFTSMLTGIQGTGDTRPVSTEQLPETNSHIEFDNSTIYIPGGFGITSANYNWTYTYDPSYNGVEQSYIESGTTLLPVVWGDGVWYGDNSSTQNIADYTIRRFTWWALASGARGFNDTSGSTNNGLVWQWQNGALAAVTSDPNGTFVTSTCGVITTYFTSLAGWHKLVPDTGSVFITAGRGTKTTNNAPGFNAAKYGDTDNYVAGSITPDHSLAVIYCGQFMSITINQSLLAAGYTATWVDPVTCATQTATPGATFNSTPLGNNSAGNPDWVLVLQGNPAGALVPPGLPDYQPQPPGWFPGADRVTTQPGGIPFAVPAQADASTPIAAVTFQGAATLSGTGSLTNTVTQVEDTSATALGGAGSLTNAATQGAGALLGGSGSVGDTDVQGSGATLSGAGSVTNAATQGAGATLGAAGSVTNAATQGAGAILGGAGSLTALATQVEDSTATVLTGTGSLTASGLVTGNPPAGALAFTGPAPGWFPGSDALTTQPGGIPFYTPPQTPPAPVTAAIIAGAATLTGTGSLTAAVTQVEDSTATSLGAAGSLTSAATEAPGAVLGGAGSAGDTDVQGSGATLAAAGSLTATGTVLAAPAAPTPALGFTGPAPWWFPGADALTTQPGGIPFWVPPQAAPPAVPVALFTVGTLTASDAALGVLTGATAAGGSGGVLTASDTRTGGPG